LTYDFRKRGIEFSSSLKPMIRHPELPTVLCMDRPGFDHDITELKRRGKRYNWIPFPALVWHRLVQLAGVPKTHLRQLGEWDHRAPEFEQGWKIAEALSIEILERLHSDIRLAAVMAANFDYGIDEGLRRACTHLPVAFVTLNREVPLFQHQSNFNHAHYRGYIGRPIVDGVAVGAASAYNELVDWNILRADQVHITGFPRLDTRIDFLRHPDTTERDSILLLTYRDPDYLAGRNCNEAIDFFAAAAARHPSITFVVKCKDENDAQSVQELLKGRNHRLVLSSRSAADHLPSARAVIGFNSLALVESLVSAAEVLVPQWGEARTSRENQIFDRGDTFHRGHVTFLESREQFDRTIDRICEDGSRPVDLDGRVRLLQQILHFDPTRTATESVEEFVSHCIGLHQSGRAHA
jgi:hypothetical protein